MFEYISVAALLLQEPRFYKFQLYTAHKTFPLPPIAVPKTAGSRAAATPALLMRQCP